MKFYFVGGFFLKGIYLKYFKTRYETGLAL